MFSFSPDKLAQLFLYWRRLTGRETDWGADNAIVPRRRREFLPKTVEFNTASLNLERVFFHLSSPLKCSLCTDPQPFSPLRKDLIKATDSVEQVFEGSSVNHTLSSFHDFILAIRRYN